MSRAGGMLCSVALFLGAPRLAAQDPVPSPFVATGLFIAAIEEGGRIFTPARLLPLDHPEALGHQFPTVLQFHRGEAPLLLTLGRHVGLQLGPTLQRYPVEPDTTWPYAPLRPPPAAAFEAVTPIVRPVEDAPLPGLRAVAYLDRAPLAFIVDTRGLSLAARGMDRPTAMGLDITRAAFLAALAAGSREVPATGPAILVYRPASPRGPRTADERD